MINTLITSVALLAASATAQVGRAIVVNNCGYDVSLTNVPSSGGGQNQIGPQSLADGGSYSQEYTQLSNGNGWSIKLAPAGSAASILQYEYTFHNDGTIWYDLSAVNGDPFSGNWALSGSDGCSPNQAAYLYPTDDAHGEQSCPQGSSVTVTLCGAGGAAPPVAPAPSGAPPASVAPQVPAPSIASPSVPAIPVPSGASAPSGFGGPGGEKAAALPATTLATQARVAAVVTNVKTMVVTQYVTVSPSPVAKRNAHLHRHAEYHEHF